MTKSAEATVNSVINSAAFEEKMTQFVKGLVEAATKEIYASFEKKLDEVTKKNEGELEKLNQQIEKLTGQLKDSNNKLIEFQNNCEELEQYSRRNCLLIAGIKQSDNEETDKIVMGLASKMKIQPPVTVSDIDKSHRLPSGKIIVKFVSRNTRDAIFSKKKTAGENIFITESLTKIRESLLFECRKLKRDKKITQCWSSNGVIKIKLNDDTVVAVKNMEDVNKSVH